MIERGKKEEKERERNEFHLPAARTTTTTFFFFFFFVLFSIIENPKMIKER